MGRLTVDELRPELERAAGRFAFWEVTMGQCVVVIHATGFHHNGRKDDIDQMAGGFVDALKAAGHSVTSAKVISGGENDLAEPAARFPLKSES